MGYVYCIENIINKKKYIGKTLDNLEKRFKEHCRDSKKAKCKDRPLYRAFNKYGISNFKINLLEEVNDSVLSEREIYWIDKLNTYGKNGYNATRGGDGSSYIDEDYIINLYLEHNNQKKVSSISGAHEATIRKILRKNNIEIVKSNDVLKSTRKKVGMFSLDDEIIKIFDNAMDAARYLGDVNKHTNISACCRGTKKSFLGYKWKRLD